MKPLQLSYMENECYQKLQLIISTFPYLHQFLNNDFIREQCENGLKCHILKRLDSRETSHSIRQHLPTLEKRLAKLASVSGYDRLGLLLRRASNWDQYQEALAQIDVTLWFKGKSLLKEIEPELPHRVGNADILLSFSQQDIYCEIASFQSIIKSIQAKESKVEKKDNELEIKRAIRNLLDKTNRQLPPNHPCILALDTTKSAKFAYDIRLIADKLLPQRLQVALIALWSWEGDGEALNWDMEPSSFFINGKSGYRAIGEALLELLGLGGEVI